MDGHAITLLGTGLETLGIGLVVGAHLPFFHGL